MNFIEDMYWDKKGNLGAFTLSSPVCTCLGLWIPCGSPHINIGGRTVLDSSRREIYGKCPPAQDWANIFAISSTVVITTNSDSTHNNYFADQCGILGLLGCWGEEKNFDVSITSFGVCNQLLLLCRDRAGRGVTLLLMLHVFPSPRTWWEATRRFNGKQMKERDGGEAWRTRF
jgi:hypothetical protein